VRSRHLVAIPLLLVGVFLGLVGVSEGQEHEQRLPQATASPLRNLPELAVSRLATGNPPRRSIVLVSADGSGARALTGNRFPPSFFDRGTWSPDGTRFAYGGVVRIGFGNEPTDIFVVATAGSGLQRLTESGRACCAVWAPDGRTIAFAEVGRESGPARSATIWLMDADGGNKRRLLESVPGRIDVPFSFSPDGSLLAFTRGLWTELGEQGRLHNTRSVHLLDMGTLEERKVLDRAADPALSPDGRRLAYVTDRDENGELSYGDRVFFANELYMFDLETRQASRLTKTRNVNEASPDWSPDGAVIAFQQGRAIGNAEGMVVSTVRADGSCARRIAFDPGLGVWYGRPVWRRDRARRAVGCVPERRHPSLAPLGGNLSLAQARRFRPLRVYWVGRRFGAFILSSISKHTSSGPGGRGRVVNLQYGAFEIQHWPACLRVPEDVSLPPDRIVRVRGIRGVFFEGGARLELVIDKTTVVIFGPPKRLLAIARALRPVGVAALPRRGQRLPPPAPGALSRRLPCTSPHRR
jgi:Tol biopolymer transport system component